MDPSPSQKDSSNLNAIILVICVAIGLVLFWWYFIRKETDVNSIVIQEVERSHMANFDQIVGNQWIDKTGRNTPGVYQGGTMSTDRFGGGFTTPAFAGITNKYVELPITAWTNLNDGYHWTLSTWLEIRDIGGTRFFHGVNSIVNGIDGAFFMSVTDLNTIYPYMESDIDLTDGAHARFVLNMPFLLTVVRNGMNFFAGTAVFFPECKNTAGASSRMGCTVRVTRQK
jgi:hypothetical protein